MIFWLVAVLIFSIIIDNPMPFIGALAGWLMVRTMFSFRHANQVIRGSQRRRAKAAERRNFPNVQKGAEHKAVRGHVMWAGSTVCISDCPKCSELDRRGVTTMYRDNEGRWRDRTGRYTKGPAEEPTGRLVVAGSKDWERIFGPVPDGATSYDLATQTYDVPSASVKLHQPTPPPTHGVCKGCNLDTVFDQRQPFACLCEVCVDVQLARDHNLKVWGAVA